MKKILFAVLILLACTVTQAFATLGVGVGVGKIQVDENLKPGLFYKLPPITVLNTGDEPSDYEMAIEHHEGQKERVPKEQWFLFSPKNFRLEPGKVQEVQITLNLPIRTEPGKYFAYLEARPTKTTSIGTTAVNIAAATKLYFTIVPGSFIEGLFFKIASLWKVFSPWPQVIVGTLLVIASFFMIKRFIKIEIQLSKKGIPKWILALLALIFLIGYTFFWLKFFQVL